MWFRVENPRWIPNACTLPKRLAKSVFSQPTQVGVVERASLRLPVAPPCLQASSSTWLRSSHAVVVRRGARALMSGPLRKLSIALALCDASTGHPVGAAAQFASNRVEQSEQASATTRQRLQPAGESSGSVASPQAESLASSPPRVGFDPPSPLAAPVSEAFADELSARIAEGRADSWSLRCRAVSFSAR